MRLFLLTTLLLAPAALAQSDSYLYGSGRQRTYSAGTSSYAKSPPRQQRSWDSRASSYRASRSWYDKRGIYEPSARRR